MSVSEGVNRSKHMRIDLLGLALVRKIGVPNLGCSTIGGSRAKIQFRRNLTNDVILIDKSM